MADAVAWTVSQPGEGTSVYNVWKLAALLEAAVRQPVAVRLITGGEVTSLLGAAASLASHLLAGVSELCSRV